MKCTLLCVLSVASFAAIVPAARAVDSTASKEIRAEYDKYVKATKAKDMVTAERIIAPGFKLSMGTLTWNRQQYVAMTRPLAQALRSFEKWDYKFGPMDRKGNAATGVLLEDTAVTLTGPDGKLHEMTEKSATRCTFQKLGGVWKLTRLKYIRDVATLDGKPYATLFETVKPHMMGHKMKKGPM